MSVLALFDIADAPAGKREERTEFALRMLADGGLHAKGDIEPCPERKARLIARLSVESPFEAAHYGYPAVVEVVKRRVVTFTSEWEPEGDD